MAGSSVSRCREPATLLPGKPLGTRGALGEDAPESPNFSAQLRELQRVDRVAIGNGMDAGDLAAGEGELEREQNASLDRNEDSALAVDEARCARVCLAPEEGSDGGS